MASHLGHIEDEIVEDLDQAGGDAGGAASHVDELVDRGFLSYDLHGTRSRTGLKRNYSNLRRAFSELRFEVHENVGVLVEDDLVAIRTLSGQSEAARDAVISATRAFSIADSRYRAGASSYLDVIDAQRSLFSIQRFDTQVKGARAASTVALIRALGGGWDAAQTVSMNR